MSERIQKIAPIPSRQPLVPHSTPKQSLQFKQPGSGTHATLSQLGAAAIDSPAVKHLQALQRAADTHFAPVQRVEDEEEPLQGKALQRMQEEDEPLQGKALQRAAAEEEDLQMVQRVETSPASRGGLPGSLKAGIEGLSGIAMNDVRVHRNSAAPAAVQAHAYAQGRDIHLGPGQEKHLPHEAWHVVQQAQGRVKPTVSVNGLAVNDSPALEAEADQMGARAASLGHTDTTAQRKRSTSPADAPLQLRTLYRGMQASAPGAATPLTGDTGYSLGLRDADVTLVGGKVDANNGGLSTSISQAAVPAHTASKSFPGKTHNTTDQTKQSFRWIWSMDSGNLPAGLRDHKDGGTHVSVEITDADKTKSDFNALIHSTQASWTRIDPP